MKLPSFCADNLIQWAVPMCTGVVPGVPRSLMPPSSKLAMKRLGNDVKLYDGSYTEWEQRGLPVEE